MAADDPRFSIVPRKKGVAGSRNRDNRNSVFCNLLANADNSLKVADFLIRKKTKPEKETWTPQQHRDSMELTVKSTLAAGKIALIAIDDIRTEGGTIQGARMILENAYPEAIVIGLTIGCTKSPNQFVPLTTS